ncbi:MULTISPECIES: DUF4446 family protein [Clostridium]|uniref:DUF4446 family protein n=1 Tax=Clostridium frigoriphilum TaxID=443253 RepID=A0ABU7UT68_9CLOT|nr:DUF4446 family protein [Clostridium sp. DSM 17811]MBU3101447.1 DUF4446 family protein [Clostridium sp. DSM 17811]
MENIINFIKNSELYIVIGLIIFVLILIILVAITYRALNKLESKYRKLMRGVDNKNLEEMVISYLDKVDEVKDQNRNVKQLYERIDGELKTCIQKTSIIRYKAFDDMGSDLSFSIALLDGNSNGFILTSIYGRDESTTYAKPVDKGISRYELSDEESEALEQAVKARK